MGSLLLPLAVEAMRVSSVLCSRRRSSYNSKIQLECDTVVPDTGRKHVCVMSAKCSFPSTTAIPKNLRTNRVKLYLRSGGELKLSGVARILICYLQRSNLANSAQCLNAVGRDGMWALGRRDTQSGKTASLHPVHHCLQIGYPTVGRRVIRVVRYHS